MDEKVKQIELRIVTPFGDQHTFKVEHVRIPGSEGYFGVLPGHLPIISSLRIGIIEFNFEDKLYHWVCSEGYAEVVGDRVTILTEASEPVSAIDVNRAKKSLERAKQRLQGRANNLNLRRAQLALQRSENRLRAVSVIQ